MCKRIQDVRTLIHIYNDPLQESQEPVLTELLDDLLRLLLLHSAVLPASKVLDQEHAILHVLAKAKNVKDMEHQDMILLPALKKLVRKVGVLDIKEVQ